MGEGPKSNPTSPGDLIRSTFERDDYHHATINYTNEEDIHPSQTSTERTKQLRDRDLALEKELQHEQTPTSLTNEETNPNPSTPNPYEHWECGFGYTGKLDTPTTIPSNKTSFLAAIKGEVKTAYFLKKGLMSYTRAINSGEHHAFSASFLRNQNHATNVTIGQLYQIADNLQEVIREVERDAGGDGDKDGEDDQVKEELRQVFAHAQPWIQRIRAILVSSHVFYKINYVLDSDKDKDKDRKV